MRVTAAKSGLEQRAMRSGPNVWGRPKLCPEGCEQNRDIAYPLMLCP